MNYSHARRRAPDRRCRRGGQKSWRRRALLTKLCIASSILESFSPAVASFSRGNVLLQPCAGTSVADAPRCKMFLRENDATGMEMNSRFELAMQSLVSRTLLRKVFRPLLLLRHSGAPRRACRYFAAGVPRNTIDKKLCLLISL